MTLLSVMTIANFQRRGLRWRISLIIVIASTRGLLAYMMIQTHLAIELSSGLCGLGLSMKVSLYCSYYLVVLITIALHLETFLYMTLQSPNIKPPPGPTPNFAAMAEKARLERVENQWFQIPAQQFTIGFDDPESDDGPDRFFAWDNEREPYSVAMPEFEAQARPVCNEEYATYLVSTGKTETIPVCWTKLPKSDANGAAGNGYAINGHNRVNGHHTNGNGLNGHGSNGHSTNGNGVKNDALQQFINTHAIKTVYGPIPLTLALDWPLMSSYQEAEDYAKWVGARIPTMHEVRSIHEHAEKQKKATLPHNDIEVDNKRLDPEEIFVDLTGCNTGLQNFHPTPVTQNGGRLSGLGDMGGAWEWSSSWFAPQPNFKPMDIYPGYSGIYSSALYHFSILIYTDLHTLQLISCMESTRLLLVDRGLFIHESRDASHCKSLFPFISGLY